MRSMAIDRRLFLAMAAAAGLSPAAAWCGEGPEAPSYLAARKTAGGFEVAVVDGRGRKVLAVPLDDRGHSFAVQPDGSGAVAFARQPGRFAVAFDLTGRTPPRAVAAAQDRHFFGHGTFAAGGRLLLATENDYAAGRGVLGVYDPADSLRRIGEFDSGGLDPHEVVLLPDGRTLCVANGGLLLHPDYGKLPLNLDEMAPALAYVDAATGDLLEVARLDASLHQLAFHHLAVDAAGHVWVGGQYHGPDTDRPPLVGRHRRGHAIEMFAGPPDVLRRLRNYIGSVAVDPSGTIVATSSPRGGIVAYWDAATGDCLGTTEINDGCGVAPALRPGCFLVSSGDGRLIEAGAAGVADSLLPPSQTLSWDNHLRRIGRG